MPNIVIYFAQSNARSTMVAKSMALGMKRCGVRADLKASATYNGVPQHDVAIFYGFGGGLRRVFEDYRRKRRAFYIDLGYWGRRKRTRWDGYHKIVLNSRHPTDYMQRRVHGPERFHQFGIPIQPWREGGDHIIVAGMSAKAAAAEGFRAEQWERTAIAKLRQLTNRPIIYRPKPNWDGARRIDGSRMDCETPLAEALRNCHAVVTHHSNVGVDAVLAGVPVISADGVATLMGSRRLDDVLNPPMPDGREQWAADLAWTQWTMEEMERGDCYRYLIDEGLIP